MPREGSPLLLCQELEVWLLSLSSELDYRHKDTQIVDREAGEH